MSVLCLRSPQRTRAIDLHLLRRLVRHLLEKLLAVPDYQLGIRLVDEQEMARVNETFLQHSGSTDVITFDYREASWENLEQDQSPPAALHGEIFISLPDAITQARQFRTQWHSELVRYIVHGVLHLRGYDDLEAGARRLMKKEENRLVKLLEREFAFEELSSNTDDKHGRAR